MSHAARVGWSRNSLRVSSPFRAAIETKREQATYVVICAFSFSIGGGGGEELISDLKWWGGGGEGRDSSLSKSEKWFLVLVLNQSQLEENTGKTKIRFSFYQTESNFKW